MIIDLIIKIYIFSHPLFFKDQKVQEYELKTLYSIENLKVLAS